MATLVLRVRDHVAALHHLSGRMSESGQKETKKYVRCNGGFRRKQPRRQPPARWRTAGPPCKALKETTAGSGRQASLVLFFAPGDDHQRIVGEWPLKLESFLSRRTHPSIDFLTRREMTGMAFGWIAPTTSFGSVVRNANRSFVVSPSFTFRTEVQRVQMPAKNASRRVFV
jgi:hypothetical protein